MALEKANGRDDKFNQWSISNLKLQVADPDYPSRASANQGHFLVTRSSNDLREYLRFAVSAESVPNAIGNSPTTMWPRCALARGYIEAPDFHPRPGATNARHRSLCSPLSARHILAGTLLALGQPCRTQGHPRLLLRTRSRFLCVERGTDGDSGDAHIRDAELHRVGAAVSGAVFRRSMTRPRNPSSASARNLRLPSLRLGRACNVVRFVHR